MYKQQILNFDITPKFTVDNFIIMDNNRYIVKLINQWPDWPGNVIAIIGKSGCGKTHLAHIWANRSKAFYISDSKQLNNIPEIIHNRQIVIDNADIIAQKQEENLLHLLNIAQQDNIYVLMISRLLPARFKVRLKDLHSRLKVISYFEIKPMNDSMIKCIINKLFNDRQISVDNNTIQFIINHTERSIEAVHKLVHYLDQHSMSYKKPITTYLVTRILKEIQHEKLSQKIY